MKLDRLRQFDQRVTFQEFAKTKTRAGGYMDGPDQWLDVITVWARVKVSGADEIMWGDQKLSTATHVIEVMQSVLGLTPQMRILWKGKELKIMDIVPDYEDGNVQVITATEKQFDET